jgi:TPR repeat protein
MGARKRGEYDEAEDLFRAALTAGLLQAEVNLGTLYRQRGMPGEARRWYRRAADRGDLLAKQALREVTDGDDTGQADQPRTD